MYSAKGFADGRDVDHCSGSVAIVIGGNVTAAITAAAKRVENNAGLRICVTEKLPKENLIKEIGRKPIDSDSPKFPLWIKVHATNLVLALSSRRGLFNRLSPKEATNKHTHQV
jgi:hypothetical protein